MYQNVIFAFAVLVLQSAAVGPQDATSARPRAEMPEALRNFVDARSLIVAEFAVRSYGPNSAANRFRSTVRGNQVLVFRDGTEDGITGYTEEGRPLRDLEEAVLVNSDGVWQKYQKSIDATLADGPSADAADVLDFRSVGMAPTPACLTSSPEQAIYQRRERSGKDVAYSQSVNADGLYVVEAKAEDSPWTTVWYIDPAQGWNAVRVDGVLDDVVTVSVFTDYTWRNGAFVPVKTVHADGADNVLSVCEIEYSKVNTPDIPAALTANDIGFLVGTPVHVEGRSQMMWGGDRLVTGEQWRDMRKRGEIDFDPRLKEEFRRADERARASGIPLPGAPPASKPAAPAPSTPTPTTTSAPASQAADVFAQRERLLDEQVDKALKPELDDWDKYVLDFIRRYSLGDEQVQKCQQILKDAKERRDSYLKRKAEDIRKVKGGKYKTEGDMKLAEEKLNLLLRPVRQTFENMKSRLMKVPTRKQLEEAPHPEPK